MTPKLLAAAVGCSRDLAELYAPHIAETCARYLIDTQGRMAAFLAQIGHESDGFLHATELWGPTPAQQRYEGRADLGNTQPGDGVRFRGRGLIQITGRANYAAVSAALRELGAPSFVELPQALALPQWACLSAGWYWHSRSCNELADAGSFEAITRKINGGLNAHRERVRRWDRAKAVLMFSASVEAAQ